MLSSIYIKNFAIIDKLEIDFHENMSVLTGATGAGKSILIDAINIVFGNKKTNKIMRNESLETEIVCQFHITNKSVLDLLEDKDLAEGQDCIFRRNINIKNTSKIYINDKPVTSGTARLIGSLIIDIHGQHENQLILSKDEQRKRLDNYSKINTQKDKIKIILLEINNLKKALSGPSLNTEEYDAKVSLLEYEIEELQAEALEPNDYDQLSEQFQKLSNSDFLNKKIDECKNFLENESNNNIYTQLSHINKNLEEIVKIDEKCNDFLDLNEGILDHTKNLLKMLEKYSNSITQDAEKMSLLNEKILLLNNLSRKYNVVEKELTSVLNEKIEKLVSLKNNRDNIQKNNTKIKENISNYHKIAKVISELRIKEASVLEKKISKELKKLGMNDCEFKIDITTDSNQINKNGYDNVSFLIKTNKKSKLLPLADIASGGELSRLSLVIQLETRSNNDCETMIFDEIDTGIGGATAEILGNHLAKLSEKTQVLCVTHLAQIAAKAKHHYLVSKDKKLSSTELMYLDNDKRVEELARMIGGIELTDKTLQFAKELIN
mgnify:FL=1